MLSLCRLKWWKAQAVQEIVCCQVEIVINMSDGAVPMSTVQQYISYLVLFECEDKDSTLIQNVS
jgi:hypothetical protein